MGRRQWLPRCESPYCTRHDFWRLSNYPTELFNHIEAAEGRIWILPQGAKYFSGDLPEEEQKLVWATHFTPATGLVGGLR